ncbi:flavodoxin family protein [Hoeflea sp. TYP-13]|uniref:flavodoxin family protein n=1 Tax=Hoeflea sp. TYP-13 TaxID=3230023 RepID=UPI0034C6531D
MDKILVSHFSLSGNTQKVAEAVAAKCDADIEAIHDQKRRAGIWGYCRSAIEAIRERTVAIAPTKYDPQAYDLVILGTPVWAGKISSPMRSYIDEHRGRFNQVAFFCCQGGNGADKVLLQMADLCGLNPVKTMIVSDSEIKSGAYHPMVDEFAGALNLAAQETKPAA